MKWKDIELSKVAILYYKKGISQKDISDLLGLSKMTISRMLRKAFELKIIDVQINLPFTLNNKIAKKIQDLYHLEDGQAIVARNIDNQNLYEFLGRIGAFYLSIIDLNNKVIGSGVGNSIGAMVKYLFPIKTKNTKIIQLMGGLSVVSSSNPFTIVQELCNKLGAEGNFLTSLATVNNLNMKKSIISSSNIENIKMGKNDLAIFGIGLMGRGTLLAPSLVSEEEFKELNSKNAVGDICGHCFDEEGKFINSSLEKRLISISLRQLSKFKQRIAIAGGINKSKAIRGALLSGIVTTLIIDENTAKEII